MKEKLLKISETSSEALAMQIVMSRSLGIEKEFASICMKELARRRVLGEDFDFETYIEENLAKIRIIEPMDLRGASALLNVRAFRNFLR